METTTKMTLEDIKNKKKREELAELLAERARVTRLKKELEETEKALSQMIAPLLEKLGIKNIYAPDDQGTIKQFLVVHGSNSSISKTELLNRSVSPDIIAACTKVTEYTTIQVRKVDNEG